MDYGIISYGNLCSNVYIYCLVNDAVDCTYD